MHSGIINIIGHILHGAKTRNNFYQLTACVTPLQDHVALKACENIYLCSGLCNLSRIT